jgi:hypothetical protein
MEFWNSLVNSALLGTAKKPLSSPGVPELSEVYERIKDISSDPEEKFLQLACFSFNYRKCGTSPAKHEGAQIITAPPEDKPYCNQQAHTSLKDILHAENYWLMQFWLEHCERDRNIVYPELIPDLFTVTEKHTKLRAVIKSCCGKRGEWISQFNPSWDFSSSVTDEELWQTGTMEQRKTVLTEIRKSDPAKGREWLKKCWQQENANTKAELLKILSVNISIQDESWLQFLLTEKSQKVKDEAWELLKQIPGSFIVKKYEDLLKQSLLIKKEKALLGLINKIKIEIKLPSETDESIYRSGIEKLSSNKEFSDDEFIVYQLLQYVAPVFLERTFETSPAEILDTLTKNETGLKLIPAIASSAGRFKDKEWARAIATVSGTFYPDIAELLVKAEKEKYMIRNFSQAAEEIIHYARQHTSEWGIELTLAIVHFASANPYSFNRQFYNQAIYLIPVKAKNELMIISAEEGFRNQWENLRDHLQDLLTLKEQVIQSFSKTTN